MIQFIEQYKELVPVIAGGMILMLFACLYIKSKFISLLNLDDIYVKKTDCTKCNKEIYAYIDEGRKEILDKLDEQSEILSEMKTSHKIFMKFIEKRLGDD